MARCSRAEAGLGGQYVGALGVGLAAAGAERARDERKVIMARVEGREKCILIVCCWDLRG